MDFLSFQMARLLHGARVLVLVLTASALGACALFQKEEDEFADFTVEELYDAARASMEAGKWTTALETLQTLEARFPYGVYAEQAQLDTIYAHYQVSEPALTIAAADRFIRLHPTHESVDYAHYLKGLASFSEDKSLKGILLGRDDLSDRDPTAVRNAKEAFDEVHMQFPDSQYAVDARVRSRYLQNALARYELHVARFYYSRRAYVAVLNRTRTILEEHSTTAAVEEALALQLFSYRHMELYDLASDSRRVLSLNFPESGYLADNMENIAFGRDPGTKKTRWYHAWRKIIPGLRPDSDES